MINNDEQVRWNIAKVFTTAEAINHFNVAVEILEYLTKDKRKYIRQAVVSALKNLMKRKTNEMLRMLNEWRNDVNKKEIVEEMFNYYKKVQGG